MLQLFELFVGMRGLPSALFYMITTSFKAKICTAFFTANQFADSNLIKLFESNNLQLPIRLKHNNLFFLAVK